MSTSDDEDEESSVEETESSEDEQPRVLPNRSTRGKRMGALVEEDEADQDFWGQEFFREEERDTDWESEETGSEPTDVPDSDFDQSEDEGDDEEDKDEPKEERKKRLAPPGGVRKRQQTATSKATPSGGKATPRSQQPQKKAAAQAAAIAAELEAPTLRASTRTRVEVAQKQRKLQQEQVSKRRPKATTAPEVKPLTQEELLAEAAKTELENARSLQTLLAREEEIKKRNTVKAAQRTGPVVRYHSKRLGDADMTVLEMVNMRELPPLMRPQVAPQPPPRSVCVVTGQPAKYRDPATGTPYATLEAYAQIEAHSRRSGYVGRRQAPAKRRADDAGGLQLLHVDAKRQRSGTSSPASSAQPAFQNGGQHPQYAAYPQQLQYAHPAPAVGQLGAGYSGAIQSLRQETVLQRRDAVLR